MTRCQSMIVLQGQSWVVAAGDLGQGELGRGHGEEDIEVG